MANGRLSAFLAGLRGRDRDNTKRWLAKVDEDGSAEEGASPAAQSSAPAPAGQSSVVPRCPRRGALRPTRSMSTRKRFEFDSFVVHNHLEVVRCDGNCGPDCINRS